MAEGGFIENMYVHLFCVIKCEYFNISVVKDLEYYCFFHKREERDIKKVESVLLLSLVRNYSLRQ